MFYQNSLNVISPLPCGWIARDLSILLVSSRPQHSAHSHTSSCGAGTCIKACVTDAALSASLLMPPLPHRSGFWITHSWAGNPDQSFSLIQAMKIVILLLKPQSFLSRRLTGKKKIKDWIVTLGNVCCQSTKAICWSAWKDTIVCLALKNL